MGSSVASDSPILAETALVQVAAVPGLRFPVAVASEARPAFAGSGDAVAPAPRSTSAVGLAPERLRWARLGLREEVMRTLQNSRALSTNVAYRDKWCLFWCETIGADPEHCDIQTVLGFLQSLLDKGRAASTLKVYVAAISACYSGGPDGQLGKDPSHPWGLTV